MITCSEVRNLLAIYILRVITFNLEIGQSVVDLVINVH